MAKQIFAAGVTNCTKQNAIDSHNTEVYFLQNYYVSVVVMSVYKWQHCFFKMTKILVTCLLHPIQKVLINDIFKWYKIFY